MSQQWKCVGGPLNGQTIAIDGHSLVACEQPAQAWYTHQSEHTMTYRTVRYEPVREIMVRDLKSGHRSVVTEAELVR